MATKITNTNTNTNTQHSNVTPQDVTIVDADGNTISLTPIITSEQLDVLAIQKRTAELLELLKRSYGSRFPESGQKNIFYDKELEGVPFLIVSPVQFREAPGFKKGESQTVANCVIQLWNAKSGELGVPKMAQLAGGYVRNQLRGMTENELVGSYLWTLARDEEADPYPRGDGWEQPRKLAPWDVTTDVPAQAANAAMTWSERVEANARKTLNQTSTKENARKRAEDEVPF